ncbi:MAG: acyl carrier protein [Burkholderiales bacterium]|nr:acyl carrier protein [Burkholderiales bacterium]MDE2398977.1 acyl carrier protein [Burkholderiales bacterium]MDE2455516.1 acyl carrier protein [Burkholderiales bacterium]
MNPPTIEVVADVLQEQFHVERGLIAPEATLQSLGLDSLTLMEFVFAIEDRFDLRIPEDRLDPRQATLTLGDLCKALEEGLAQRKPAP